MGRLRTLVYIGAEEATALGCSDMPTSGADEGGRRLECILSTWPEIRRSASASFLSRMMKRRSKRESRESGRPMFCNRRGAHVREGRGRMGDRGRDTCERRPWKDGRSWEMAYLHGGAVWVILAVNGVGGGDDGAARVE